MALALADVLEDFGCRRLTTPDVPPLAFGDVPEELEIVASPLPELPDVDALIRLAVEQAERELADRLTAEHEAALVAERERHASEIQTIEQRYGELLGSALAGEMTAMRATITAAVTSATARILGPVLSADMHARSMAQLAETLKTALEDVEATRVRVTGPAVLYEALCQAAGETAQHFEFAESDATDLTVRIDDRLFETRFAEWSAAMEEILS